MLNKFGAIILVLLLAGCMRQTPSTALNITLKSPLLKFKGQGFLSTHKGALRLDLYSLARFINTLKIDEKICLSGSCYRKISFNKHFFKKPYYEDLLQDIIECKPIFTKKNLQKSATGFSQRIKDLSYEASEGSCIYKDSDIFIKISR